jgi:hypothetical protein
MPYITQDERKQIALGKKIETPGQLNYVITDIVLRLKDSGRIVMKAFIKDVILTYLNGRASYTLFNEVMGVLECARFEFLRRKGYDAYIDQIFLELKNWLYSFVAPYEDRKKEENGDVY